MRGVGLGVEVEEAGMAFNSGDFMQEFRSQFDVGEFEESNKKELDEAEGLGYFINSSVVSRYVGDSTVAWEKIEFIIRGKEAGLVIEYAYDLKDAKLTCIIRLSNNDYKRVSLC